jgi:uncharacterized membrane protein (UPF0127 family)
MRTLLTTFFAAVFSLATLTACAAQNIGAAQPTLPQSPLVIETQGGPIDFTAELAQQPREVTTGMMFRERIGDDEGMLFDMGSPREVFFWMRNTQILLDIIFISADGRIHNIAENAVPYSEALIPSLGPTRGVLEIGGGRAAELGIAPGDLVRHELFGNGP